MLPSWGFLTPAYHTDKYKFYNSLCCPVPLLPVTMRATIISKLTQCVGFKPFETETSLCFIQTQVQMQIQMYFRHRYRSYAYTHTHMHSSYLLQQLCKANDNNNKVGWPYRQQDRNIWDFHIFAFRELQHPTISSAICSQQPRLYYEVRLGFEYSTQENPYCLPIGLPFVEGWRISFSMQANSDTEATAQ